MRSLGSGSTGGSGGGSTGEVVVRSVSTWYSLAPDDEYIRVLDASVGGGVVSLDAPSYQKKISVKMDDACLDPVNVKFGADLVVSLTVPGSRVDLIWDESSWSVW